MFASLTKSFNKIFDYLTNSGTLSKEQIEIAVREIRLALLDADVALPVVKDFINIVKEKALGQEIVKSVSPGQMVIKIIHDELINILSAPEEETKLKLNNKPPVNILMVGLQGSGKTTASAKLALKLKNQNKKVLLVSLDTYRPAAQEQLKILADSVEINSLAIIQNSQPLDITRRALNEAKLSSYDVVIYDTAGRLHIDDEMMNEIMSIKSLVLPIETILVVDSMIGQDAITIASNFDNKVDISGIILSRIDGDSRGGAALSIKHITKKPIKFLSSGEKLTALEDFDAKRLASRILDMGDVVSFVEKAASVIDQKEAERTAARLKKGKFDLNDYLSQIRSIKKLGGIASMVSMLPGASKMLGKMDTSRVDEKLLSRQEAIILSMSAGERKNPDIINASRKKRIASGSGTTIQEANTLLKHFIKTRDLMKRASRMDPESLKRNGIGKLFS